LSCPERIVYLEEVKTASDYERLLKQALEDIRQEIYPDAKVSGIRGEHIITSREDRRVLDIITEGERVREMDGTTWAEAYGARSASLDHGMYVSNGDKTILRKDRWCRKTMIHEALHGVSTFSYAPHLEEGLRIKVFVEALTEFLTGLILYRKYPECYEGWRLNRFEDWCGMGTKRSGVKIFCAFSNFVRARRLIDLYFWQEGITWSQAWARFIEACPNFTDIYEEGLRTNLLIRFKYECEEKLGKRFRKKAKGLDYSTILI